ncbi:MAG: methionyl-tRNA formyltransferase [Candidatus Zixiibacteriota bacterium]
MNIVYMGTPEFACPALKTLADSNHTVSAVVTGPDKPVGRGKRLSQTAVAQLATDLGLPLLKPASLRAQEFFDAVRELAPDLIVVIAFRILPKQLYSLPSYGAINIHASLLPKYRGAAPINWALINGESETGLSAFSLRQKVDTGDIILQQRVAIADDENYDSLYRRLSDESAHFLMATLDLIQSGKGSPVVQDSSRATPAPKIGPFDAMIDFGMPAKRVVDFVRGLSTHPGAYTNFRSRKTKIYSCRAVECGDKDTTRRPGSIIPDRRRLLVQCASSVVELLRLVPEGKREMDGQSFVNGFRPKEGELFGDLSKLAKEKF